MKINNKLKQSFIFFFLLSVSSQSYGIVLSTFDYSFAGGQSGPSFNYLDFELSLTDINSSYIYSRDYTLFDDFVIGMEHLGTTFVANEATDTGFNDVVQQLTNGVDNYMTLMMLFSQDLSGGGSGGGTIRTESEWLFGEVGLGDLSGYMIDSIEVTVNNVFFTENFITQLSGMLIPFYGEADVTITIYGEALSVPEPGGFFLLITGVLCLFTMRNTAPKLTNSIT